MKFLQSISKEIAENKYLKEGESVSDLFHGVAEEVASCESDSMREEIQNKFFDIMDQGYFIPGGRILANARPNSKMKQFNNCFTIDVEDSMEGITNSIAEYMSILKTGGGVGFDISKLRPKGSPLSKGGVSSGPMSFLDIFDTAAKTIKAGNRRGASIAILRCDHPDIEEFITYKKGDQNEKLTQFNISVGITNEFMVAVELDKDWDLVWDGEAVKTVKAKYLYDLIAANAFFYNEPGVLFLDTIEENNNGWWAFILDRCNPCGEIVMPAYSLCCLGALNLTRFIKGQPFTEQAYFDLELFEEIVPTAVRFLDDVLDTTEYPLQKIEDFSKQWRRIGLGITGLADMLAMLRIPYGSQASVEVCELLSRTLRDASYNASCDLAIEKGAFPSCDNEKLCESHFISDLPTETIDKILETGLRNIAMMTIAPTGTTSLSLGNNCSSGVEPIFSLEYQRKIRQFNDGTEDTFKTEQVMDYAWLLYCSQDEHFGKEVEQPDFFVTTEELTGEQSIAVQAAWQKHIDHSISKTLNLPSGSTREDYDHLFHLAWQSGLKGFTSFNPDGFLAPILSSKPQEEKKKNRIVRVDAPRRPKEVPCDIYEWTVKGDKMLVLVGLLDDEPYEVFCTHNPNKEIDVQKHKTGFIKKIRKGRYDLLIRNGEEKVIATDIGNTFDEDFRSIARLVSGMLRHGADLQFVIDQLNKTENMFSFQKAVSRSLKKYLEDGKVKSYGESPKCDSCGSELHMKEGCLTCPNCGNSKCS